MRRLAVLFDMLPLLPRRAITWLLESRTYRYLPNGMAVRQLLALALALIGDAATSERIITILGATVRAAASALRWRMSVLAGGWSHRRKLRTSAVPGTMS